MLWARLGEYRLAVGRLPTDSERTDVVNYLADYRKAYEGAKQPGNAQFAAWSSFCQALFESALFRYVY